MSNCFADRAPVHGDVSGIQVDDPGGQFLMQLWKGMKRDAGITVMLDVVGHIPNQESRRCIRPSWPAVIEHIADVGASRVFRKKKQAEKRLSNDHRNNPQQ